GRLLRVDLVRDWLARSVAACSSDPPTLDRLFGQRGAWPRGTSRGTSSGGTGLLRHVRTRCGSRRARRARAGSAARAILFITQAINAVLLLPLLAFIALLTR